jgi:hypothetical protein
MTGTDDLLFEPGSGPYRAATTPDNSTAVQQPAVVALPRLSAAVNHVETHDEALAEPIVS